MSSDAKGASSMTRRLGLVCIALVALAGCGGEKTVYSDAEGNEVKVTREGNGDASAIRIENADGSANVNIDGAPADTKLPLGLKLYPGAKIVSTMISNSDGKAGGLYMMETDADRDTVMAWYRKAVVASGFKIESELTTPDLRSISASKDGGSFSLQVVPSDTGSSITLLVGEG